MVTHLTRNMKLYHPVLKWDCLYNLLMISHDKGTGMTYTTSFFNTNAERFFNQLVPYVEKTTSRNGFCHHIDYQWVEWFFSLKRHKKVKRLEPNCLFYVQIKPSIWCKLGGKSMPFGRLKHVGWAVKACWLPLCWIWMTEQGDDFAVLNTQKSPLHHLFHDFILSRKMNHINKRKVC